MTDEALKALAQRAGIALEWRDYADKPHTVSIETIRRVLSALGFACDTADAIADSTHRLESRAVPPLITATVGAPVDYRLPLPIYSALRASLRKTALLFRHDLKQRRMEHGSMAWTSRATTFWSSATIV